MRTYEQRLSTDSGQSKKDHGRRGAADRSILAHRFCEVGNCKYSGTLIWGREGMVMQREKEEDINNSGNILKLIKIIIICLLNDICNHIYMSTYIHVYI